MIFNERKLSGVFEIKLNPIGDERGFFMRVFDDKLFEKSGIVHNWVQENHSKSGEKGIIRGIHLQMPPYSEAKLVRAVKGKVLDVFVDLRKNSPTFGQWDSVLLSEELKNYVLVPRGFGHSICTLEENSEIIYKVDNYYSPENEIGINWNDPDIGIDWPIKTPILSEKDKNNISLKDFINKYNSIDLD